MRLGDGQETDCGGGGGLSLQENLGLKRVGEFRTVLGERVGKSWWVIAVGAWG